MYIYIIIYITYMTYIYIIYICIYIYMYMYIYISQFFCSGFWYHFIEHAINHLWNIHYAVKFRILSYIL